LGLAQKTSILCICRQVEEEERQEYLKQGWGGGAKGKLVEGGAQECLYKQVQDRTNCESRYHRTRRVQWTG
jgi:hypothetical protein